MSGAVRVERGDGVATVLLDRPPLNVLDLAALAELDAALGPLASDGALRLVLVRGAGERAFSAGVAVEDHTPDQVGTMLERFHGALAKLQALPTPTAAVVHGHCLGGGMELAAACDLVVASDAARFGQPEIKLGCYPPYAAALYPQRLGAAVAADLLLTGRTLSAAEAEAIGFVTRRVAPTELEAAVERLTNEITVLSAAALRLAKQALRAGRERPFAAALAESERLYLDKLAATADMEEGIRAFLDKRPPRWQHR